MTTTPTDALTAATDELADLLPKVRAMGPALDQLCDALLVCWRRRGKVLVAGNGGSAADAMHFAEELVVRFHRDRRPFAALALLDPTVLTCAANDMGYDPVFSRQVEALGNPGDVFVAMTTSGNSENLVRAVHAAKKLGLVTVGFLGKDGGRLRGVCDVELLVGCQTTARIQEAHKLLFHALCVWVDAVADEV